MNEETLRVAEKQPNVLLICTDHLSGPRLGCAGHPSIMTPTIDQFARWGVRFSNAYSACPACIPARRSLMTGMSPRVSGMRYYREGVELPDVPSLAQSFRNSGYQAYAVGKFHVSPQRDRIGFAEDLLEEQGRHQFKDIPDGDADDYELYLADAGYGGQEYSSGMTQNEWISRSWHLPEQHHPVNWATREMCRFIRRRDPRKPSFWYLSFSAPHPPLTPPQAYLDLYRDVPIPPPAIGDWAAEFDKLPFVIKNLSNPETGALVRGRDFEREQARRAYYATITHIDHQIRVVIGYLREAGLIDDTIIAFTSDHGHMAGEHGLWCMTPFYEMSAKIPLIVVPRRGDGRIQPGTVDDRFAEFADLYPTLLELAGIEVPSHVDARSLIESDSRDHLYGEYNEGRNAMRMVRSDRYKLIYYATGNRVQLFDLEADPKEEHDLATDPSMTTVRSDLEELLISELYGGDSEWVTGGKLTGLPDEPYLPAEERLLKGQRGLRFL